MKKILLSLIFLFLVSCSGMHVRGHKIEGVKPFKTNFYSSWSKNLDPEYETGNLPVALSSPLIHESIVYCPDNAGSMAAYDLFSGKEIWKQKDGGQYHSKPIVYKDQLIYGTAFGRVYSRNLLSGELKYSVDLGAAVETKASLFEGRVLFQTRNHKIVVLDVESGKILWSYTRSVPFVTTLQGASTPVVYLGKVYVGFADGHVLAFSLEDGNLLWDKAIGIGQKFVDVDLTPVFVKDKMFIASWGGNLLILNPDTGDTKQEIEYQITRAPFFFKDKILLSLVNGEMVVLNQNYMEERRLKISKGHITSFSIWKNSLLLTTVKGELVLLSNSFEELERRHLGHPYSAIFDAPALEGEFMAVYSSRNRLYLFK